MRAEDFFLGYRRVDLAPHEVLARVALPFTRQSEYAREFKQAHRRDDDIAIVNAGMRVRFARGPAGAGNNLSSVLFCPSLQGCSWKPPGALLPRCCHSAACCGAATVLDSCMRLTVV